MSEKFNAAPQWKNRQLMDRAAGSGQIMAGRGRIQVC
jgi:hypothetical protein